MIEWEFELGNWLQNYCSSLYAFRFCSSWTFQTYVPAEILSPSTTNFFLQNFPFLNKWQFLLLRHKYGSHNYLPHCSKKPHLGSSTNPAGSKLKMCPESVIFYTTPLLSLLPKTSSPFTWNVKIVSWLDSLLPHVHLLHQTFGKTFISFIAKARVPALVYKALHDLPLYLS